MTCLRPVRVSVVAVWLTKKHEWMTNGSESVYRTKTDLFWYFRFFISGHSLSATTKFLLKSSSKRVLRTVLVLRQLVSRPALQQSSLLPYCLHNASTRLAASARSMITQGRWNRTDFMTWDWKCCCVCSAVLSSSYLQMKATSTFSPLAPSRFSWKNNGALCWHVFCSEKTRVNIYHNDDNTKKN